METKTLTPAEILALWPSRATVAQDLAAYGVTLHAVHKWKHGIPGDLWAHLVAAADARGIALCIDDVARAHARPEAA